MSKLRVGLLSILVLVQVLTIVGGYFAYEEMSQRYRGLWGTYADLVLETKGIHIDPRLQYNPFRPLLPLVLFGLFLTIVLLADEMRNRKKKVVK